MSKEYGDNDFFQETNTKGNELPELQTPLSQPVLISKKANNLTMSDVIEGVETFYKRCKNCGMCFRYQEHDRSIHIFNDTFLIGFDVCNFLRQCLQEHL